MNDGVLPLAGIKVLDVGTFIFGPATATVMSDFGAEVTKIEPPGIGDPYRYLSRMPPLPACDHNYCWILDARNKKSLALDLKSEAARAVLLKLVAATDVFISNFPPAVIERLGLTYDELREVNPRLVYAHVTGFGEEGEEADKPGYDATAWWARSGLMDIVRQPDAEPGAPVPGMGDHPSSMALFGAVMMALYQRERTGEGAKVTSSLMANGIWANSVFVQAMLCGAPPYRPVGRRDSPNAVVNAYATRDAQWLLLLLVQEDKDWERFVASIERLDLTTDPRFAQTAERRVHAAELIAILDEVFAAKDYCQWREILDKHGITFSAVTRLRDIPDDAQMAINDIFVDIDDARTGALKTVDSPIWMEGRAKAKPRLAPEIGEHTEEVLAAIGYGPSAIRELRERGAIP